MRFRGRRIILDQPSHHRFRRVLGRLAFLRRFFVLVRSRFDPIAKFRVFFQKQGELEVGIDLLGEYLMASKNAALAFLFSPAAK